MGALLVFSTNVVAILLSGLAVMALFRVNDAARSVATMPSGTASSGLRWARSASCS